MPGAQNQPACNMNKDEVIFILGMLRDDITVFEYGMGGSTVLFSQWVRRYYAADEMLEWAELVMSKGVTDNVLYLHCETKESFVNSIEKYGKHDIILVDSSRDSRIDCAYKAIDYLKPDGLVLFHDWDRECYRVVLDKYDVVEVINTLAVLKPK